MARRIALVLLVLLALVAIGVWWLERNVGHEAERLILKELARRGVPDASLRVVHIGLEETEIAEIRLGREHELEVARVVVRYSVEGLQQGRVDSVTLSGVDARFGLGPDGLDIGSLAPLLEPKSEAEATESAAPALPPPPVGRVVIEDFRATVELPQGTLPVSGRIEYDEGRVALQAKTESFMASTDGVEMPVPALELELTGEPLADPIPFEATVRDPGAGIVGRARGSHALASRSGAVDFELDPVRFAPEGLQPVTLVPLLAPWIQIADGTLESRGEVRWGPGELTSTVHVAFRDFDVKGMAIDLGKLNGAVTLEGPWPLYSPAGQLISMASVDFGLQLTNGLIAYHLLRDGSIDLESARWTFADGRIETRGRLVPGKDSDLVLEAADIDLARLLELAALDGLTGEGRLSGRLPVSIRGTDVYIENGRLSGSREGGWLRYRPDSGVGAMGGGDRRFGTALTILENFHWTGLELTLNGNTRDETVLKLHFAGANPDYMDGHPVEFNLSLEAQLADLLRKSAASYEIPAQIEKRLADFARER